MSRSRRQPESRARRTILEQAESAINAEIRDGGCGYEALRTKYLERNGRMTEYTVYRPTDMGWHPLPHLRDCWWELSAKSGEPMGRFAYVVVPGEYDTAVDYWKELRPISPSADDSGS